MREVVPHRRTLVIIGAGGFGGEVLQYLRDATRGVPGVEIRAFFDDRDDVDSAACDGIPLLGSIDSYQPEADDEALVAIGDPVVRTRVINDLRDRGARFFDLVHPTAFIATTAKIGNGCIIGPFCAVGNRAVLGDHVVMPWYASVAHDATVGSYAVFSPYSTANGGASLGEGAFLGTHAVVNPLQRVGAWAKVAAGSVVYREVPPGQLALGNPARSRPMMHEGADRSTGLTEEWARTS
jgi:sugar O-acyltransferase (sialic acid O-acetyltransferase NeuD family)